MTVERFMSSQSRLDSLDTLRGVAILLVMVFHCAIFFQPHLGVMKFAQYGAHGVQLFFVISAYTMCYMWQARQGESNPVLKFFIRRFFRIAPLFWLVALAWFAFWWLHGGNDIPLWKLLATLFFVHGFSPETNGAVVPGGWSIAVEMVFYALFPLVYRFCSGSTLRTTALFAVAYVLLVLIAQSLLVVWMPLDLKNRDQAEFLYQSVWTQLPVFLLGILAFQVRQQGLAWRAAAIGFLLFVFSAFALKYLFGFNARPFFWVICALLALYLSVAVRENWSLRPVSWLGGMSYSLYLSHFAVLDIFHWAVPSAWRGTWLTFGAWTLAVIAVSALISLISKHTLEEWSGRLGRSAVNLLKARAGKGALSHE
jgi:peptidoglycan/LPS O-acetylase OafA/YrhL